MNASGKLVQHRPLLSDAAFVLLVPAVFVVTGILLRYWAMRTMVSGSDWTTFASELCRWDCEWYVRIANEGYDRFPNAQRLAAGNWAFFPLTPLFVAGLRLMLPFPTIVTATIFSTVVTYVSAVVSWPLLRSRKAYALYAAFLLSGPLSIYYTTFFSEVLFVLFLTCVLVALRNKNYLLAGIFAALLSATRIVGVFIVIALVVEAFAEYWHKERRIWGFIPHLLRRPDILIGFLLAPLGLMAYIAFLYWWMGDGLAFSNVQRAWGRSIGSPFGFIWAGLSDVPHDGELPLKVSQQLALSAVVGIIVSLVLIVRRQIGIGLFCLACILVPAAAGLASMVRFVSALVPITTTMSKGFAATRFSFAFTLGFVLLACYLVTCAWLSGHLALV